MHDPLSSQRSPDAQSETSMHSMQRPLDVSQREVGALQSVSLTQSPHVPCSTLQTWLEQSAPVRHATH
jgi:hypothetical protein